MRTKLFTLFLAFATSVGTIFAESGTCGDNLTWDLTNGVLTISGFGDMTNWEWEYEFPWFSYRESITSVIIEDGVTSIGNYAFSGYSGLTSATIPNSVTSIGNGAFRGCSGLTNITVPNSVTSIGNGAFIGCNSVTLNCNELLKNNYSADSSLSHVIYGVNNLIIGDDVTRVGKYAFYGSPLQSVKIGYSVKSIVGNAFGNCSNLMKVTLNCGDFISTSFASETPLSCVFGKQVNNYIIGDSVKVIGNNAFRDCYRITSIIIGKNVTEIGRGTFQNCTGLTSITIPSSVTSIGCSAFEGCSNLSSITCSRLIPPTLCYTTWKDVNKNIPLYVPNSSVNAYRSASYWKEFFNVVGKEELEGVVEINSSATIGGPSKFLRDGQILILRGDKTYTLTGQEIK